MGWKKSEEISAIQADCTCRGVISSFKKKLPKKLQQEPKPNTFSYEASCLLYFLCKNLKPFIIHKAIVCKGPESNQMHKHVHACIHTYMFAWMHSHHPSLSQIYLHIQNGPFPHLQFLISPFSNIT